MAIANYREKLECMCIRQNWTCPICNEKMHYGQNLNFHHAGIENTKQAREKYPLFLDSVLNGIVLHQSCHIAHGTGYGKMQEIDIINIEAFLQFFKECVKDGIIEQRYNAETHDNIMNFEGTERGVIANREYIRLLSKLHCDIKSLKFTQKEIWEAMGK